MAYLLDWIKAQLGVLATDDRAVEPTVLDGRGELRDSLARTADLDGLSIAVERDATLWVRILWMLALKA